MGKIVHMDKVREFARKTPAFSARDVGLMVGDRAYAALMLHNLEKRGQVHRIKKGWYSLAEDPIVSVYAFRPSYLGLQEALTLRNLWEQETNVVLVTPLKVRPGVRSVMGSSVIVRRIDRDRFFGFDYLRYGDFFVPVSDVEKTLIDLAYFGELPDEEVLKEFRKVADRKKVETYLKKYSGSLVTKVRSILR